MKICFLTHNIRHDNGAGVFSSRLIAGLKKDFGIESLVFTSEAHPRLWTNFFEIRRAIKKCDTVHALDVWPYAILAYFASLGLRKKLVITAVGSGSILPFYNFFQAPIAKLACRSADKMTAISNFTKNEILKHIPGLKIDVITHGVDYEKYFGQNLAGEYRPYILSVGSLRWRKGYHRSIPAFAEVSKVFPELKYIIVGKRYKGVYYERMVKLISDFGLEEKVVILDGIDDESKLISLYKNAELFCLLSQTANRDLEGFGLVFLEAAAAGLPVVATAGSGTEDAVDNGKNGVLIPDPTNSAACAREIIKILSDKNLKSEMSENSLAWAKQFGWTGKLTAYKKIYEAVLVLF